MNDMSSTIVAKSDQINAADLIGTTRTIVIKEVRIKAGDDQPVTVLIEGDKKGFRPCKGVRRLMVRVWGADASKYIGQAMTLFCDPSVTWAGKEEGGIRVSHMSGLDEEIVEYMRISRAATKPYKIFPLVKQSAAKPDNAAQKWVDDHLGFVRGASDLESLDSIIAGGVKAVTKLSTTNPDLHKKVTDAYDKRRSELAGDDRFAEGPTDSDRGESHTGTPAETLISTIAEADADTLATIEAEYFDGGRLKHEAEDQDRIEQAFADAKARLGGES